MSPRPRERILENLERIYREAYDHARATDDRARMFELDASYQREQLLLEVLLDIRDGLYAVGDAPSAAAAVEKLEMLRKLSRPR